MSSGAWTHEYSAGMLRVQRASVCARTRMSVRLHGPGAGFLKISLEAFQVHNLANHKGP